MNFTAALNEVLSIVKRPDKSADMAREINSAVNFFCTDSDFKRDVEETLLPIIPTDYSQLISYSALTRFRKVQYMKHGGTRNYIAEIQASKQLSSSCSIDKFYVAGTGIRINLGSLSPAVDIGYYQYPPQLTAAQGDFWLLDLAPYMIIDRAAGKIFTNIGDDASGKRHLDAAHAAYLSFRADQTSGQ